MVIIDVKPYQDDENFYDCVKIFTIWESLLLCVWSFSTLCCNVCEFVQTLPERKLGQSHKKPTSYIHVQTNLTPTSYKLVYAQNPNLI